MMLPSVILHAVCWTLILVFASAQVHLVPSLDTIQQLLLSEFLLHLLALFHMTIHPLVCLWNSDILRREARDCCPICFSCWIPQKTMELPAPQQIKHDMDKQREKQAKANRQHRKSADKSSHSRTPEPRVYGENTETHFELLNSMWDKPEKKGVFNKLRNVCLETRFARKSPGGNF